MWRTLIAVILILAFAGQAFNQAACYLGYYLNKSIYIKNCENKARPQMHCNGRCQLMKKIKEQEKNEQRYPEIKITSKTEILSSKSFFATIELRDVGNISLFNVYLITSLSDHSKEIFHPPGLSA